MAPTGRSPDDSTVFHLWKSIVRSGSSCNRNTVHSRRARLDRARSAETGRRSAGRSRRTAPPCHRVRDTVAFGGWTLSDERLLLLLLLMLVSWSERLTALLLPRPLCHRGRPRCIGTRYGRSCNAHRRERGVYLGD
jgi:hypothetical protein